jgi:hypothetical protein
VTRPTCRGFIPLVDAAALIVAVNKGFTAAEGLDIKLVPVVRYQRHWRAPQSIRDRAPDIDPERKHEIGQLISRG